MRTKIAFLLLGLWGSGAPAQEAEPGGGQQPALPRIAATAQAFAPRGWQVETQARGDLNGDGAADLAFVLLAPDRPGARLRSNPHDDDPTSYANPRMLGIAFARPEGGYRLAVGNRRFLPPKWAPNGLSQGWMLFEDGSLDATRGRLRVTFQYTRSRATFTLRWQNGAFRVIGYDSAGVEAGCLHSLSVNFLTGRAKMMAGNIDEERQRVLWRSLARRPLLSLDEIGEGEEFDPQGLSTRFPLRCPERE